MRKKTLFTIFNKKILNQFSMAGQPDVNVIELGMFFFSSLLHFLLLLIIKIFLAVFHGEMKKKKKGKRAAEITQCRSH
jgi:uncharacterized membrane protein